MSRLQMAGTREAAGTGHQFAVYPQMWVPEEELHLRVEDAAVVTVRGIGNLASDSPLKPDDVEAAMREASTFPTMGP